MNLNEINTAITAEPAQKKVISKTPAQRMNAIVNAESSKELLQNCLKENAGAFAASIIEAYSSDKALAECDPGKVFKECLKAAALKLPINKNLGLAYILPYKNRGVAEPQFQIGYKGFIQLALRSGVYKNINTGVVYEGELKSVNKLTGEIDLTGEKISDKVIGYFAYTETVNGFCRTSYWTKEAVEKHAEKFSKSYHSTVSPWSTSFDEMAEKTVLKNLLSKYGVLSVELQNALTSDFNDETYEDIPTDNKNDSVVEIDGYEVNEEDGTISES